MSRNSRQFTPNYVMRKLSLKPELLRLFHEMPEGPFTVAELTRRYLIKPGCLHSAQKPARQFIYRNMLRMIKASLMVKLPTDGGWPKYRLTSAFATTYPKDDRAHQSPLPEGQLTAKPDDQATFLALQDRLNQHRSDILCAIGEAEELNALCREMPAFSESAKPLYTEARERSSLLLGKIKALESLLSCTEPR